MNKFGIKISSPKKLTYYSKFLVTISARWVFGEMLCRGLYVQVYAKIAGNTAYWNEYLVTSLIFFIGSNIFGRSNIHLFSIIKYVKIKFVRICCITLYWLFHVIVSNLNIRYSSWRNLFRFHCNKFINWWNGGHVRT